MFKNYVFEKGVLNLYGLNRQIQLHNQIVKYLLYNCTTIIDEL